MTDPSDQLVTFKHKLILPILIWFLVLRQQGTLIISGNGVKINICQSNSKTSLVNFINACKLTVHSKFKPYSTIQNSNSRVLNQSKILHSSKLIISAKNLKNHI